ncbi:MAG: HAD-IC family P-type ATPase [Bacillales bacterium]
MKKNKNDIIRYYPSYKEGLNDKQIKQRFNDKLNNVSKDYSKHDYIVIFAKNIFTFYNIILFTLGFFLLISNQYKNTFFLVVVISNTVISLTQDLRAKIKLEKLSLLDNKKVKVIRNSEQERINIKNIVLDDVIHLKAGEQVPCDSVVLEGTAELDESILTGESLPQHKESNSTILSGSYILSGELYCRVSAVGDENLVCKIKRKTLSFKSPKSQLFLQLNRMFKAISIIVIFLGVITVFIKGINENAFDNFESFKQNIGFIAGAFISMIPSGMYLLISTTLTACVLDLASKKILVNDMYSIETLARVNILCLDKTGTITDGNMQVYEEIILNNKLGTKDQFDATLSSFINATGDDNYTAKALKNRFGTKAVFNKIYSIPFNSENKYSSATLEDIGTITIGAYGFVPLSNNNSIKELVQANSAKGYRVLVIGYSSKSIENSKSPDDMETIGIILLQEQLRKNAKKTIKEFIDNNVDIKIISGDNELTVSEIAKKAGVPNAEKSISLKGLSDDEVKQALNEYSVFGRVSLDQKELMINYLKSEKNTVAMFGDGVNDILALKTSNVAITIGNASKAAKDVSGIVLYNNDFGLLPEVICQGRRIINNLTRTCSLFLIKTVYAILINIFFIITTVTRGQTYPFEPRHFYAWDVIGVGVASFFLALEKNNNELVKGSFIRNVFKAAFNNGVVLAIFVMFLYMSNIHKTPQSIIITKIVYLTSFASIIFLYKVTAPFNLYRFVIFIFAIVGTILMYAYNYIGDFNILGINNNYPLSKYLLTAVIFSLGILLINFLVNLVEKWYSKKRG